MPRRHSARSEQLAVAISIGDEKLIPRRRGSSEWRWKSAQVLESLIRHQDAVADMERRGRRLPYRAPAAVIVLDPDLPDVLGLGILDAVADVAAAQRADNRRRGPAAAAADEATEAAADQAA